MSTLTIRNLDDHTKQRLRERAAANGRSMEEEARIALRTYMGTAPSGNAYDFIRSHLQPVEDVELPRIRGRMRPPSDLFKE